MADDFKEYMETEISVMLKEKAIEWIQKNAAGFRMEWDRKNCKIVKRTKRRAVKKHDME
jgi:elongation factor P hydroxylase